MKNNPDLRPKTLVPNTELRVKTVITALGVVFIAANLRAPLTSVGPVIADISRDLGLSNFSAGMLTTVPLMAFALLSGLTPRLSRKWGMEWVLFASMLVLLVGLLVRPLGSVATLFIGAALLGTAITMGNVLMPAFIKNNFPNHIGWMTGIYSAAMNLTAALAAGFSIQLGQQSGLGWKGSLGVWAILAILAVLIWIPQLKKKPELVVGRSLESSSPSFNIYKSKMAWCIALFMGLQSLVFYCAAAWLPKVLQSWGMNASDSGWMLSYIQFAQLPLTFIGPIVASRMSNQKPLVWITSILMAVGALGLVIFQTQAVVLWCICIGIASGLAFSLSMMFFVLRTNGASQAAEMSGMAQSLGYLLAACGPPLFGVLFDYTNNWTYSLLILLVAALALLIVGLVAAQDKQLN